MEPVAGLLHHSTYWHNAGSFASINSGENSVSDNIEETLCQRQPAASADFHVLMLRLVYSGTATGGVYLELSDR
jgi:hypothetical protein